MTDSNPIDDPYAIAVRTLHGEETTLEAYRDHVLLVVNVASQCGFTPQYEGLEGLQRKFASRGFSVLGFPCNQFGSQEPGTAEQIQEFCSSRYSVSFPLFTKIEVNGPQAHPLYRWLKSNAKGLLGTEAIKWNFTKFLVDRGAKRVERFAPSTAPESLEPQLHEWLSSAS